MAALDETRVVQHLLFHKALLDVDGDAPKASRINEYIQLVRQGGEGEHVRIEDPFDRAIALAFELVTSNHLNPWDIDLVKFSRLYLEKVKARPEIDLLTAGRLLVMAWTILKMQSEDLRAKSEPPAPAEESVAWEDLPDASFLAEEVDFAYTHAVVDGNVPLDEKLRHKGDRKVTLMELVEALEQARAEAELRIKLMGDKEAERLRRRLLRDERVGSQVHKEDQEAEIAEVWGRIASLNGHPIALDEIHDNRREDLVKALVSVLFLARANRVKLWQEDFPYGTIYVQNVNPEPHASGEEGGMSNN